MKKKWRATAIILSAALLACACSAETDKKETGEKKETAEEVREHAKRAKLDAVSPSAYGNVEGLEVEPRTYFSVIGKTESAEYWKAVRAGAEEAVNDINRAMDYEGADKVKVVYSAPAKSGNVDEQVNVLDEELARYPDALGIALIDTQSCSVQFDLATQNGIPIVTYDSSCDYQGIMANIATDDIEAAKEAAVHMAESINEEGQVLIIAHDGKSLTGKNRVKGFVEELETNHPEVSVANTYYMDDLESVKKVMAEERLEAERDEAGDTSSEEGTPEGEMQSFTPEEINSEMNSITDDEVYQYMLEKNPDIKGIYATNGTSIMSMVDTVDAGQMEEKNLVMIAFDANSDELKALDEGKIDGLILQNPYAMGYAVIVAEARCVLELGNEAQVDTGYTWVTADNVKDKEVQRMLYTE